MQTPHSLTLTAANDNPGGATRIAVALDGLISLLARAKARRGSRAKAPSGEGRSLGTDTAPLKGTRQ